MTSTGTSQKHVRYDSFGRITSQVGTLSNRFWYTGREWDSEIGLYYYRARYYDPRIGRFMSEDPIGFDAGDGNLYRYVINTPVNSIDPLGTLRMLPRTAPLPVLRPTPVGPKPFIPPWLWPWFSPISPFWATPLDTREEDVVKANKKCRRGELDPPWPERDKWPRNCQFDYKIPGEMINIQFDICVYACRQAGRSFQIQRTIEKGTMCPKWFEWVPTTRTPNTPDIDPNNLPPDAIP